MNKVILLLSGILMTLNLFSQDQDSSLISKYDRNICLDETKDDYQKSVLYFRGIIAKDSADLEAYYNLGMSYYKSLDFLKAIEIYDQLIEKDSCFNYALHNRAICKFFLKDRDGACKDFERALQCSYPNMSGTKKEYERFCK